MKNLEKLQRESRERNKHRVEQVIPVNPVGKYKRPIRLNYDPVKMREFIKRKMAS